MREVGVERSVEREGRVVAIQRPVRRRVVDDRAAAEPCDELVDVAGSLHATERRAIAVRVIDVELAVSA